MAGILLSAGLFVPRWSYRIAAILLICLSIGAAIAGHERGMLYRKQSSGEVILNPVHHYREAVTPPQPRVAQRTLGHGHTRIPAYAESVIPT